MTKTTIYQQFSLRDLVGGIRSSAGTHSFQVHPYHLVEPSPWPLGASVALLITTLGGVMKFHGFYVGDIGLPLGIILIIFTIFFWCTSIIIESTYQGYHTSTVKYGLTLGLILFIVSEICLFFSLFWAFFHSSLSPSIELGSTWPPVGIFVLNPFEVPLLNTIILLTSGATITVSHAKIISGNRSDTLIYLFFTILLAFLFLGFQWIEYNNAAFTIADGIYGSTFFTLTGMHGFHVLVGSLFLIVSFIRIYYYQLTANHHLWFEFSILYWHCVDVIWLFVFIFIYYWGSSNPT